MTIYNEYIILGCGPAGLQLGFYLHKLNKNYIILEKNDKAASFFDKYPHSGELISINKRFNNSNKDDFNLRHDWNSLCNDYNLQFKDFSDDYYPKSEDLVTYMNTFATYYNLNINYNTNITYITKKLKSHNHQTDNCELEFVLFGENQTYTCKYLIVATGLSKMNIPENILHIKDYSKHYGEFPKGYFLKKENRKLYNDKRLLIVGNGNSAFEIANLLNNHCSNIMIIGKTYPKLAFITHYTGDVRTKYMNFYETFLLKSLNVFDSGYTVSYTIEKTKEDSFILHNGNFNECGKEFDEIINCSGWSFDSSIFDELIKPHLSNNNKYPIIYSDYSSANVPNMFFIGSLMHFNDHKLSSGGFIHGFRYLIDNFVKINITDFNYTKLNDLTALSDHFKNRINTSSALYQMYGQLCDVFYYDKNQQLFIYYEHIPLNYLFSTLNTKIKIPENNTAFVLTLEYGSKPAHEVHEIWSTTAKLGKESDARLLHPVLRICDKGISLEYKNYLTSYTSINNNKNITDEIHFIENAFAEFIQDHNYKNKFERIVKSYLM
jgi:hypothetical protein